MNVLNEPTLPNAAPRSNRSEAQEGGFAKSLLQVAQHAGLATYPAASKLLLLILRATIMQKNTFLNEISQELARFDERLLDWFRCPACLRDLPIGNFRSSDEDNSFNEEHIIPDSVGGKQTTFLCKRCNSTFGHKQTKWLVEWIELNEGGRSSADILRRMVRWRSSQTEPAPTMQTTTRTGTNQSPLKLI